MCEQNIRNKKKDRMTAGRAGQFTAVCATVGLLTVAIPATAEQGKPENLARKAKITATSEYDANCLARFVADGIIPMAGRRNSSGTEWTVQGRTHKDGAELTMECDKTKEAENNGRSSNENDPGRCGAARRYDHRPGRD